MVVETGQSGGKGVAVAAVQADIGQRPGASFGQDANTETVLDQDLQGGTGE